MFAPRWVILLIGVAITAVVSVLFLFPDVVWVGHTDLNVEFVVTDAASGQPVPDAQIEIQSEGGFYEDKATQEFSLVTDGEGSAKKVCRNSMCFGRRSRLFLTNTFVVHLPWWHFRAVKEDFEPTQRIYLDVPDYIKQAHRTGSGTSKLVVLISLNPISVNESR